MNSIAYLIPAYQPSSELIKVVQELRSLTAAPLIIVNDGSGSDCLPVFEALSKMENVQVLTHAVNLGKGAALKTGFNHALVAYKELIGVVTVDADGQHR